MAPIIKDANPIKAPALRPWVQRTEDDKKNLVGETVLKLGLVRWDN